MDADYCSRWVLVCDTVDRCPFRGFKSERLSVTVTSHTSGGIQDRFRLLIMPFMDFFDNTRDQFHLKVKTELMVRIDNYIARLIHEDGLH